MTREDQTRDLLGQYAAEHRIVCDGQRRAFTRHEDGDGRIRIKTGLTSADGWVTFPENDFLNYLAQLIKPYDDDFVLACLCDMVKNPDSDLARRVSARIELPAPG